MQVTNERRFIKVSGMCSYLNICDALHNLVPFAQFKKREEHPYVLLLVKLHAKSNTVPWVFFTFFKFVQMVPNCTKRLISSLHTQPCISQVFLNNKNDTF